VGDKTGTGANGAHNDMAFALLPGGGTLTIVSMISGGDASAETRARVHASVARFIATGRV